MATPEQVQQLLDELQSVRNQNDLLASQFQQLQENVNNDAGRPVFNGLRMAKPDTFSARGSPQIDDWLFQVREYFESTRLPAADWVPFAATLLRGRASTWWRITKETALNSGRTPIKTWDHFAAALRQQFRPVNTAKTARDRLVNLRQTRSVQDYAYHFRSIIIDIPGMTEDEKIDRFVRGLKDRIRQEVDLREPGTLDKAISLADRYDAMLFRASKNDREFRPARSYAPKATAAAPAAPADPDAMDIDSLQQTRRAPLTDDERDRLRRTGRCFHCRQHGHIKANCPKLGQQGNARTQ